jgi:hypothetical protein
MNDEQTNDPKGLKEPVSKQPRLKKDGTVDKRSFSSLKNLQKGANAVQEIVKKAKAKHGKIYNALKKEEADSSDEEESDTEYFLEQVEKAKLVRANSHQEISHTEAEKKRPRTVRSPDIQHDPGFQFKIEELTKSIDDLKNENKKLKENVYKQTKLSTLNSLSQKMMLKF